MGIPANNNSRKESIMDNLLKLLGSLFVLSLLVLPPTGCDNPPWEGGMILNLKVDTPRDGTTVSTSTVTVSGRVTGTQSASAKVKINGADVPVKDGKYSTSVTLTEGTNVLNIVAEGGGANLNEKVTVTYAPAK
jgi:Glucodextranase, domain B